MGEKDLTLVEIAQELSYADQAHFTHAFRRWAGVSPGQYPRVPPLGRCFSRPLPFPTALHLKPQAGPRTCWSRRAHPTPRHVSTGALGHVQSVAFSQDEAGANLHDSRLTIVVGAR
jgi:hypothetical protein